MRGRQMRKKGGTSKTRIEKSSIPRSINPRATRRGVVGVTITSGDVHVANNNLVFCCYICICCLKLHQANYHVEEFWIIFFIFLWVGGWRRGGGGYLDMVGELCTQLQCIYYLVPYTVLQAAEGISAFQTSFLFILIVWTHFMRFGSSVSKI